MKVKEFDKYFIFDEPKRRSFKQFVVDFKSLGLLCYAKFLQMFTAPKKTLAKKYRVSICAIFKNEAQYLKEWVEYNLIIGIEHFYMYNNNSEDDYLTVLKPYIDKGIITLVQWEKNQAQMEAYLDCVEKFSKETNWLGFIDIDEFINPIDYDDIYTCLKPFEKRYGSVLLYWKMFGTSGKEDRNREGLVIEDFTSCWNKHVNIGKCFFNTAFTIYPKRRGSLLHHSLWTKRAFGAVPPVNVFGKLSFAYFHKAKEHFPIQINHYVLKSKKEFIEKKSKGDVYFKINPHDEEYFRFHEEKCFASDDSIFRFIKPLKIKMNDKNGRS